MGRSSFGGLRRLPSGRWQASYEDPHARFDAPRRRYTAPATFATKTAAREWLAGVHAEIAAGTWEPPEARAARLEAEARARLEFAEFAAEWLARYPEGEKTWTRHESILRVHVLPRWGAVPLAEIAARDVRLWLMDAYRDRPATRVKVYETMRTCLNAALRDELIGRVPMPARRDIAEPGEGRAVPRARASLDFRQIVALADAAAETAPEGQAAQYRAAVLLMGLAGLRMSEARGLRPADLERDAQGCVWASIAETVKGEGVRLHAGAPKNATSRRTLPLPAMAGEAVAALAAQGTPRVLARPTGEPLAQNTLYRRMISAAEGLGLGHVTPHDLRHSFITQAEWLAPHVVVKAYAGHAGADMTERYARVTPDMLARLADAVDTEARKRPSETL